MFPTPDSTRVPSNADRCEAEAQAMDQPETTRHYLHGNASHSLLGPDLKDTNSSDIQLESDVPYKRIPMARDDEQRARTSFNNYNHLETVMLLQKIESLTVKVNDLDQRNREKGTDPNDSTTNANASCSRPQNLALQAISATAKAKKLPHDISSNSQNAHNRTASVSEDMSFLGPVEKATMSKSDGSAAEYQETVFLKSQLALSLQVIESMKLEVYQLRNVLARKTAPLDTTSKDTTIDTYHTDSVVSKKENSTTLTDTVYPTNCLKVDVTRKQTSTLPSPRDPGVSSAFLRGTFHRPNTDTNLTATTPKLIRTPSNPVAPHLERHHSEPCLPGSTLPPESASNIPESRYDHLTFFPGTSNTPTSSSLPSIPIDTHGIWAITPDASRATDSMNDSDSNQDKSEIISYRRIMERNTEMNWAGVVDKIVYTNDQQASVALQQKLKIATTDHKGAIVDAIILQAFPLMINKFGNFLIQKCFEHGTTEQIDRIASAIRGNVLTLSKDAFGCHVVQKALDNVSEVMKSDFVSELLLHIKETVTHRYACHVWQKLFEIRWIGKVPDIMSLVNAELKGCWDQIALEETGSLVVQNIFENCIEEERRPCIDEVLANVKKIIRGQWGNWVIQHIVEHGSIIDREVALEVVMVHAIEYSVDQYASKVIEKAIKSGDPVLMSRYLDAITQAPVTNRNRTRMPLIDIASDQYGNYLIQYILTSGTHDQKALVASHIRRHMVSMRGSRYGAKVAFTVERMRNGDLHDSNLHRESSHSRSSHNRNRGPHHHGAFIQRHNSRSG